jgi:hypothetical protein
MLDYVKYIEHSEENLQFYLWYKSYEARFELLSSREGGWARGTGGGGGDGGGAMSNAA